MAFIAHIYQWGESCDCTIACGQKLIELKANTHEDAYSELKQLIRDQYTDDRALERAVIYEVLKSTCVDLDNLYVDIESEEKLKEAEKALRKAEQQLREAQIKLAKMKQT